MVRILPVVVLLALPAAVQAQSIRGRVIDDESRQALAGTDVALLRGDSAVVRTATDANGFYTFSVPAPGSYQVRVTRVGYAEHLQSVTVQLGQAELLLPAVTLKTQAIRMDAVQATAESAARAGSYAGTPVARPMNRLAGERLARLEKMGVNTHSAIRELGAGLRVRQYTPRGRAPIQCIETTRRTMDLAGGTGSGACQNVILVIDGVNMGPAEYEFVRTLRLADYESIEFITPMDAGQRWGSDASARGALVLYSRNSGPHRSAERNGGG